MKKLPERIKHLSGSLISCMAAFFNKTVRHYAQAERPRFAHRGKILVSMYRPPPARNRPLPMLRPKTSRHGREERKDKLSTCLNTFCQGSIAAFVQEINDAGNNFARFEYIISNECKKR